MPERLVFLELSKILETKWATLETQMIKRKSLPKFTFSLHQYRI